MVQFDEGTVEAVADAWASIDGNVDQFRAGKGAASIEDEPGGHYSGYLEDATELMRRLLDRGFIIVPNGSRH